MKKDFNYFIDSLQETNTTLDCLVDFDKTLNNKSQIELKLNQLNYLIGKENLREAVNDIYRENPNCFSVLNILVAVRENRTILNDNLQVKNIFSYFDTPELICEFIEKTGLAKIFKDRSIKNLVDYVFGIEVGLDTNARKNRGGATMERVIRELFISHNIKFRSQVESSEFKDIVNLGIDLKRFDFVVDTRNTTYLIEVNFYNGRGSKLNEVSRAYTDIAAKIDGKYEFVWITDGEGWKAAENNLQEAYNNIDKVYNLTTVNEFIETLKKEI